MRFFVPLKAEMNVLSLPELWQLLVVNTSRHICMYEGWILCLMGCPATVTWALQAGQPEIRNVFQHPS